jgi:hypothetical protein
MKVRRYFKQNLSLDDRLRLFSDQLKAKAAELQPGPERDALLQRARIADVGSAIDQWLNSRGSQPQK